MKRALYFVGGAVMLALGIAKVAAFLYFLSAGRAGASSFTVKQGVYAITFIVGGVAFLLAARPARGRQGEDAV